MVEGGAGDGRGRDRVPGLRRPRLPCRHPVAQPVRAREQGASRGGRPRPPPGVVLAVLAPHRLHRRSGDHGCLALPRRLVGFCSWIDRTRRRSCLQLARALDPGRLRLLPLHRQLRDPDGAAAPDEPVADAGVRAGRRRVGRQARRRPRPGGGEGGGPPRRHDLAVGRGVRARRRQARARAPVPGSPGHGQDDAREGARDRIQLAVRVDAGLGLRGDVHRHRRDRGPPARTQGEEARTQVGRSVHRLHRRDRRGRNAPPGAPAVRARGRPVLMERRERLQLLRTVGRAEPERRPDRRDPPLARASLRPARSDPAGRIRS